MNPLKYSHLIVSLRHKLSDDPEDNSYIMEMSLLILIVRKEKMNIYTFEESFS